MSRRTKILRGLASILATVLVVVGPAMAVLPDGYKVPVDEDNVVVPWAGIGIMVLCLAVSCAVAFKNPHRSHQEEA